MNLDNSMQQRRRVMNAYLGYITGDVRSIAKCEHLLILVAAVESPLRNKPYGSHFLFGK